jgi:hypothetical protein
MRALIGLAIAGAAVGGTIFLVRRVRAKRAERAAEAGEVDVKVDRKRKPMHAHAH